MGEVSNNLIQPDKGDLKKRMVQSLLHHTPKRHQAIKVL